MEDDVERVPAHLRHSLPIIEYRVWRVEQDVRSVSDEMKGLRAETGLKMDASRTENRTYSIAILLAVLGAVLTAHFIK